jgi:hypothetical protein
VWSWYCYTHQVPSKEFPLIRMKFQGRSDNGEKVQNWDILAAFCQFLGPYTWKFVTKLQMCTVKKILINQLRTFCLNLTVGARVSKKNFTYLWNFFVRYSRLFWKWHTEKCWTMHHYNFATLCPKYRPKNGFYR